MSTVTRILDAVAKHDPDAARVMAADTWWEEASAARQEMFDEQVPLLVGAWEAAGPLLAQRVGREYVVAKAADASATFDPRGVLAEYTRIGEVIKAERIRYERGGNVWYTNVSRDAKGRFSRSSSQRPSEPSSWSLDTEPGRADNAAPRNVRPYLEADPRPAGGGNRARFPQGFDDDQAKARVKTYLGAVKEVKGLQAELRSGIPAKELGNYQIRVQFASSNVPDVTIPANAREYDWDLENGLVRSYQVEVSPELQGDAWQDAAEKLNTYQNLSMLRSVGISDTKTLEHLARVLNGSTNIDTPRTRRYADALRLGSSLAGGVGAMRISDQLDRMAGVVDEGERLRPALTRAAYRYRGTEKRPDPDLALASQFRIGDSRGQATQSMEDEVAREILSLPMSSTDTIPGTDTTLEELSLKAAKEKVGGDHGMVMPMVGQRVRHYQESMFDRPATNEQLRLAVQRDLVSQAFANRLMHSASRRGRATPEGREGRQGVIGTGERNMNRIIADISQNIGRGLPSEGLLIDAKGNPVAQSVGAGGDHYQPFTAASLGRLRGGQYVRTRQHGGITADDLRVLLTGGGRAATVVSGSGVFDIEFDPALRDQRRFSDKALGMVQTYERILDQLAAEEVYSRGLDPQTTAEVRQRARLVAGEDQAKFGEQVRDLTRQKLIEQSELTPDEIANIESSAAEQLPAGASPVAVREAQDVAVQRAQADKVRALSLNAEGYEVALRALQRYYPYFIRDVSYRSLREVMSNSPFKEPDPSLGGAYGLAASRAKDREYVRPGAARFGQGPGAYTGLPNELRSPLTTDSGREQATAAAVAATSGGAASSAPSAPAAQTPAQRPATPKAEASLPTPVQEMAGAARANVNLLADAAKESVVSQLAAVGDEADSATGKSALESWVSDKKLQFSDSTTAEKPWLRPDSEATLLRIAEVVKTPNVFPELVNYVRGLDPRGRKVLLDNIDGESFDAGSAEVSDGVKSALSQMVTHAFDVADISREWVGADAEGFDGRPKVFDFVRRVASLDDVDTIAEDREVAAALKDSGVSSLDVDHALVGQMVASSRDLLSQVQADPAQWQQLAASKNPRLVAAQLLDKKPELMSYLQEVTGGFSDSTAIVAAVSPRNLERKISALERVYAAQHLQAQKRVAEQVSQRLEAGGVDPKAARQAVGLDLLQGNLEKSQSPRLIVTRFLPRSHPVAVAVNKGFRVPM